MEEINFIRKIRSRAGGPDADVVRGIGDDCAVIDHRGEEVLLWGQDMLVEGTHFLRGKADAADLGWKAVAVNISDIAAMGGRPKYILVSIGIGRGTESAYIDRIYDGIFRACESFGLRLLGGDTVASEKLVLDVSIIGSARKKQICLRSGASAGDLIIITGPVRDGKNEHLTFLPRLAESVYLAGKYHPSSMIDVSDGIAPDVIRLSEESGKGCVIFRDAVPLSEGLSFEDAMFYGESFELMFTLSPDKARRLFRSAPADGFKNSFFIIGEMTSLPSEKVLIGREGAVKDLQPEAFDHFSPGTDL
jgi:thiamine-monophosphate kinase